MYSNFILNSYIVYELNTWPLNPTNSFTLKKSLFSTVNLVRNSIKRKFTFNSQGIALDWEGSRSFSNNFARNVVIFCVDNSSSSQTNNQKKIFLESGDGPTQANNDFFGSAEKQISINFSKANTIFCVSLQYIADESYLHVNKIRICKFKTKDNINKDEHKISLNGTA